MAASGKQVVPREPTGQDKRILEALCDHDQTIPDSINLNILLPMLVKSGYITEERREKLKKKTQSDTATAFHLLLTRKKSQALRRGFLLALKESGMSVPNHQIVLTTLTEAAGMDMKSLEEERVVGAVATVSAQVSELTTPSLPPFKYHYPLDDNPSTTFSSSGGLLYSPVYGVTVYIPAGAILGEEQVEVSFRLVKEEAEIQELLSHPLFKGSVLCSGAFEFKAKLVAPDGEEFGEFHSDVWMELPHCLSFKQDSLKDYSTAFVASERRGNVEVEEQALFSAGYPYVNLPVRHFSKYHVQYAQPTFTWPVKHRPGKLPSAGKRTVAKLASDLRKLSLSSSSENGESARLAESPITKVRLVKEAVTRSSSLASEDSPLSTDRQTLLAEVRFTTHKSTEQPVSLQLVHQDAVDPANGVERPITKGRRARETVIRSSSLASEDSPLDTSAVLGEVRSATSKSIEQPAADGDDMHMHMDVDAPSLSDCYTSLDRELLHGASMSLYTCVYQPMGRYKCSEWTADIVFTPLLPQALDVLMYSSRVEFEYRTHSFELDPSQLHTLRLRSELPSDLRGWTVQLDRMEILLEEFNVQSALLSRRALTNDVSQLKVDASYSKMAAFFPKSVATVHNRGASLPLLYPIEVERSSPLTLCFLTCETRTSGEEEEQCSHQHRKSYHETSAIEPEASSGSNSAERGRLNANIVWSQDQCIFVLLSLLLPENMLSDVARQVGMDELQLQHVKSLPLQCGEGERMYDLFKRAVSSGSLSSFEQLQACLSKHQSCRCLVSIVESYLTFRSSLDVSSGDPHGDNKYQLLTNFLLWAMNKLNHSLPTTPDRDSNLIIAQDYQRELFLSLCRQLYSVWKMAARLLGLEDSAIDELATKYDVVHDPCECSYQMLRKWAGSCPTPSDVSYVQLHIALSIITLGTCAANAAFTFIQGRITNLLMN